LSILTFACTKDLAIELLICGSSVADDLVDSLVDKQLDDQFDEEGNDSEDSDDDSEEAVKRVRVAMVLKYYKMYRRSFSRKRNNPTLQILSVLRLGEEYLGSSDFYHYAIVCLNGAQALCLSHEDGREMELFSKAVAWEINAAMKRARYARNNRNYAKLNLTHEDEYEDFQARHYTFLGKLELSEPSGEDVEMLKEQIDGAEETGFPSGVIDTLNSLFDDDDE
jgi:hypothetical protein